ncbi:MAG TPA: hypothetical protein VGG12_01680, partial [Methylovirgula sp.]
FYSFADAIGVRFPLTVIRLPIVLLVAFCAACVALTGFEIAVHHLSIALMVDRGTSAGLVGFMIVILLVPAGLSGVIWGSVAALIVTIAATALPLLMGVVLNQSEAIPVIGSPHLWTRAVADISAETGAETGLGLQMPVVIAFALGISVLTPLFNGVIATRSAASAWRSSLSGGFWLVGGGILLAATIASAALTLEHDVVGKTPADLPTFLVNASEAGHLTICGQNTANRTLLTQACAKTGAAKALRLSDIAVRGDDLLASLPALRGSEPTLSRLASAFAVLLGIGLAAAGLQSFITALANDFANPARRQLGPVSRRLAVARGLAIAFVVIAGIRLSNQSLDARFLLILAVMLSAGLIAPLVALTFLPRASSLGALAALCVATFVMVHFFTTYKAPLHLVEFATDAVFAATDGFFVALFIAFLPKWPARESPATVAGPAVTQTEAVATQEEILEADSYAPEHLARDAHVEAEPSTHETDVEEEPLQETQETHVDEKPAYDLLTDEGSDETITSRLPPEDSLDVP